MKDKLKLVLVVPNFNWIHGEEHTFWDYVPYNLCLLAAMVEDICEVDIIDAYAKNMDVHEFKEAVIKSNPDIVGITVLIDQFAKTGHLAADIVKSADTDIIVIMGGVYVTMSPDVAIADENVDYIVIGEGEYVLKKLIQFIKEEAHLPTKGIGYRSGGETVITGREDFIEDLDSLPFPAYRLIDFSTYVSKVQRKSLERPSLLPFARIMSSRGCPFSCVFCQSGPISGKKFRARSAENILDEIKWLKGTYDIQSIVFEDDNFFLDRKRVTDILNGMIDQGFTMPWVSTATAVFRIDEELLKLMRRSGCEYLNFAIETGCDRVLTEIIHKPIDYEHARKMTSVAMELGIYISVNFIIGFPTETWHEIRQTIKIAEEFGADYVKIFCATPQPHTRLWDLCKSENAFKDGYDYLNLRWNVGQIETKEFSANDLTILRAYEWDRINFTCPEKRKKTAQRMHITEDELLRIRRRTIETALMNICDHPR